MILRTLRTLALALICAAAVITGLVLVASALHHVIAWIAADERIAWGTVAAIAIVGLVFVLEGRKRQ